jgi:hypothetical protein
VGLDPDPHAELVGSIAELVPASSGDRYFDLAFIRYRPLRPAEGKFAAESLLWHSLQLAGIAKDWEAPLGALRERLGPGRLHWGVADARGQPRWTLRIANPDDQIALVDELRDTLAPWVELAPGLDPAVATSCAVIVGFGFDAQTLAQGQIASIELHRRGERPRDMLVERHGPGPNHAPPQYSVFESKREIDEILPRLRASETVDVVGEPRLLGRVLIPELFASRWLHVGSDRVAGCDSLGFCGVNVEQLLWFVRRFEFPAATLAWLASHQHGFTHLLFDVQLRYRQGASGVEHFSPSYHGHL